jgi:hypothetical protein
MKKKLICVLGALILMNPLSFVFGFHCHRNGTRFYCHRRHTRTPLPSSTPIISPRPRITTIADYVTTSIPTPTPTPTTVPTPMPTPTQIPTAVNCFGPMTSQEGEFFSYNEFFGTWRIVDEYWHQFFLSAIKAGFSGREYYKIMREKMLLKYMIFGHVIPEYISRNFLWICTAYDEYNPEVIGLCQAQYMANEAEGNLCIYNYYNGISAEDEL